MHSHDHHVRIAHAFPPPYHLHFYTDTTLRDGVVPASTRTTTSSSVPSSGARACDRDDKIVNASAGAISGFFAAAVMVQCVGIWVVKCDSMGGTARPTGANATDIQTPVYYGLHHTRREIKQKVCEWV